MLPGIVWPPSLPKAPEDGLDPAFAMATVSISPAGAGVGLDLRRGTGPHGNRFYAGGRAEVEYARLGRQAG